MNLTLKAALSAVTGVVCPILTYAQSGGVANGIKSLQGTLDQLYKTMIPQCSQLIGIGQGIAGFAALWYIGVRVWRHIAHAEPVDVFPLLRPFAIGGAIMLFPFLIGLINDVLQPTVTGTAQMEQNASAAISELLKEKQDAILEATYPFFGTGVRGAGTLWDLYMQQGGPALPGAGISSAFQIANAMDFFGFKSMVLQWLSEILQILFEAAALCINTLRTFQLIVLAILGPLVLGLSVFNGFEDSFRNWLRRYICVFFWLPVANIFGSIIANIQVAMIQSDISQIQNYGSTYFSSTDAGYLIFLILGIVGYFSVPTVAGYIVSTGANDTLANKAGNLARSAGRTIAAGARAIIGAAAV
ncbi:MAG: conjugative transposon protein TraJ [Bacteroidetes bacterium]|nr:conjugative transposon protein TraJ [Bacteroidota bacterium]